MTANEREAFEGGLRRALELCKSQRLPYDEHTFKIDPYRRGQYRGAQDCCTLIEREIKTMTTRKK